MNCTDLVAHGNTAIEGMPNCQACPVIVDYSQQHSSKNTLQHNGGDVAADGEVEAIYLEELDRVFEEEVDEMVPLVALKCASRGCKINGVMFHAFSRNG